MNTENNNIEIVMCTEADEVIEELFESLLQKYQEGLEEKMRGSESFLILLTYCIIK